MTPKNEVEIRSAWMCSNGVWHNSGEVCDTKVCARRKQAAWPEPAAPSVGAQDLRTFYFTLTEGRQDYYSQLILTKIVGMLPDHPVVGQTCTIDDAKAIARNGNRVIIDPHESDDKFYQSPEPQGSDNSAGPGVSPSAELKERAREMMERDFACYDKHCSGCQHNAEKVAAFASSILEETWRCFHCNFVTSDPAEALAHFGEKDDAEEFTPICKWWQLMEQDERIATLQDTLQQLNAEREQSFKLEQQLAEVRAQVEEYSRWKAEKNQIYEELSLHPKACLGAAMVAIRTSRAQLKRIADLHTENHLCAASVIAAGIDPEASPVSLAGIEKK